MTIETADLFFEEVYAGVSSFLESMYLGNGMFKYTYSSDIVQPKENFFGLASSVFALKIGHMTSSKFVKENFKDIKSFIFTFRNEDSTFHERFIARKSFTRRMAKSILSKDLKHIMNVYNTIAETRQTYAALKVYNTEITTPYNVIVEYKKQDVKNYFNNLDWRNPWHAASHVSHLAFFSRYCFSVGSINEETFNVIKESILECLKLYQDREGFIYIGNPSFQCKVNALMKVCLILESLDCNDFFDSYNHCLTESILKSIEGNHGCDLFNTLWVTRFLNKGKSSSDKIKDYCLKMSETYSMYYHKELGGFSFFKNRCSKGYYGARVTKSSNEPDIHGTSLFLWGIVALNELLGLNNKYCFPVA